MGSYPDNLLCEAQVNDTELFPALKTTFEDPDAENGDSMESLFDHHEAHQSDPDRQVEDNASNEAKVCFPLPLPACKITSI